MKCHVKHLDRITKMTIKYEFKFPDGRVAWQEIAVNRADIVALPLLQEMDARIGQMIRDNPTPPAH